MSIRNYGNLVVMALVGWGSYLAIQQPLAAGGPVVSVAAPVCDSCNNCERTLCKSFCYKMRLHCIYARRGMTQKFVLVPTSPSCPDVCPMPNASPYGQPTIGGYSSPPINNGPAGVFIR